MGGGRAYGRRITRDGGPLNELRIFEKVVGPTAAVGSDSAEAEVVDAGAGDGGSVVDAAQDVLLDDPDDGWNYEYDEFEYDSPSD